MGFVTSIVAPLIQLSLYSESLDSKTRMEIIKLYKHWVGEIEDLIPIHKKKTLS